MSAYVDLQQQELKAEQEGYTAVKHQQEVGTGYFDNVLLTITGFLKLSFFIVLILFNNERLLIRWLCFNNGNEEFD
jgi:hypothetical protein